MIVFDEIQSAPKGLTYLKYFNEDAPEYYIIASDSLLGMNLHNKVSFPVGKVSFLNFRQKQLEIITTYERDFSKYAPYEIVPRLNMVWHNIPAQLSKENKKFVYGAMKEGARAKDFELAIQWLVDSGVLFKNYRISTPSMPLIAYQDFSSFKLYFNDVGLLAALSKIDLKTLILGYRAVKFLVDWAFRSFIHRICKI